MLHTREREREREKERERELLTPIIVIWVVRSPEVLPFTHSATVRVDGKELADWAFFLQPLGDHWVTVARGPPGDVVDAFGEFSRTLRKRAFAREEWEREIQSGQPGFAVVGIR